MKAEGGHIREMDDTPGKERIHERHNSGTGYEILPGRIQRSQESREGPLRDRHVMTSTATYKVSARADG